MANACSYQVIHIGSDIIELNLCCIESCSTLAMLSKSGSRLIHVAFNQPRFELAIIAWTHECLTISE